MSSESAQPLLPVNAPEQPDSVDSPILRYGALTALEYPTRDGRCARVLFERLDALKLCRGEHSPVALGEHHGAVCVVEGSRWLVERHAYEARHYRDAYNFGGDVDEMLVEFEHYLFLFHDQFVEAIAGGIWIELADERLEDAPLTPGHPFLDLPEACVTERIVHAGLTCQVRRDPRPREALLAASVLCEQPWLEFALELDGKASINQRVGVRTRRGVATSRFRNYFGNARERYDGVVELATVRPLVEAYMTEVAERRRELGLS